MAIPWWEGGVLWRMRQTSGGVCKGSVAVANGEICVGVILSHRRVQVARGGGSECFAEGSSGARSGSGLPGQPGRPAFCGLAAVASKSLAMFTWRTGAAYVAGASILRLRFLRIGLQVQAACPGEHRRCYVGEAGAVVCERERHW